MGVLEHWLCLRNSHPDSLDQMGGVELAGLGQEVRAEAKVVLVVGDALADVSQPNVVERPLLVLGLEEAEHGVGRAAGRVVAGEDAVQQGYSVEGSRLLNRSIAFDVNHRLEGEEGARVVGDHLGQEGGPGRPGGQQEQVQRLFIGGLGTFGIWAFVGALMGWPSSHHFDHLLLQIASRLILSSLHRQGQPGVGQGKARPVVQD